MKLIIFDHLKRWWLLWITIGIANYFVADWFLDKKDMNSFIFQIFGFQIVFWLGAMELNYDLARGSGRVLTTLPMTAGQIGRAWWIFSVALPALFLAASSGLALFLHSTGATKGFPVNGFFATAITNLLFLGAIFYMCVGSLPGWQQTPFAWVRMIFFIGLIIGVLFVKPTFETPQGIILLLVAAILTVASWFRAEQMVLQRASFRLGAQIIRSKSAQYKAPAGFGGLPFLWQCLLIRLGYFGLGFVTWMILNTILIGGMHGQLHQSPKQLFEAVNPALSIFPYFFIFMFLLMPLAMNLRALRTLPISRSALAATLVFFPVGTILIFYLALAAISGQFLNSANSLTNAVFVAILVPLLVWRGLGRDAFAILCLIIFLGSISPIFFIATKIPPVVTGLVSIPVIVLAWEITRRLLQCSSKAYRSTANAFPNTAWGAGR